MQVDKEDLLRVLIPPLAAVALTLLFFAVFNRWDKLDNPINSIVTPGLAAVGFAFGVFLDRLGIARARKKQASEHTGGQPG